MKWTQAQLKALKEAFESVSEEKTGESIKLSQLGEILQVLGYLVDEITLNKLTQVSQLSQPDIIYFDEFVHIMEKKSEMDVIEEIEQAYSILDFQSNERVTPADMRSALEIRNIKYTENECQRLVDLIGNDGTITLDQLKTFLLKK